MAQHTLSTPLHGQVVVGTHTVSIHSSTAIITVLIRAKYLDISALNIHSLTMWPLCFPEPVSIHTYSSLVLSSLLSASHSTSKSAMICTCELIGREDLQEVPAGDEGTLEPGSAGQAVG